MIEDRNSGVRIFNAGVIILWPFLTRFFETLAFVENGDFATDKGRYRSVFLLQQLAYNSIDFPEYELVLNKLLVGLPLAHHLPPTISNITAEEENLCISLLNGLISNWNKVQSSTPEAIQETFLQREGVLTDSTDAINLEIEKKGVDVLLQTLHWDISLIKLPWMTKPIHVEWI